MLRGVGIGAGYFAGYHYEAWSRIPRVQITAVCDTVEEKARALMSVHGIGTFYRSWREMIDLEKPDFIDIITPPPTHEEKCRFAGERGVHVICQKPLAPSLDESRRIVDTASRAGVRFMVHENWRWQPWYRKVRDLRDADTIGEFTHLYFRMRTGDGWGERAYLDRQPFFHDYPRLLVYETGVHFIDTFRFLLGEPVEVFANLRRLNPVIRGEETGQLFFRFQSGATAIWDANRYNESESAAPRYTFGEMRIDAMGGHLTMDSDANIRLKPLGSPAFDVDYPRANVNFAGDCVYATLRHFTECVLSGAEFETSGPDYLKTLAAVEAVYRSASENRPIAIES